ncbi:helix-turn-helix domain-containing protein [Lutispora sp.]|uniref:helix-turn-helix domain-containing protein n=1 Tax=Lutispora sp. TaxID=2828727 RepID=UPI000ED15F0D|nr:XRE family transcriptional regulator [Lutispora sp.]MEA4963054.1 XRE family transcriptional regulator [Lutispora sp.]HCJ55990.1 hypothetical protein [Clostridiaceae bacterium]
MIGDKIREARKNKSMTLNDLASCVGVTASYISQLERNIIDPSISALRKISRELGVPMFYFFDEEGKDPILIKAEGRRKLKKPKNDIEFEYISPVAKEQGTKMELFFFRINPRSGDEFLYHNADECIFIIKGSVKVFLEDVMYNLEGGDSIFIKENVPHKIYNAGSRPAIGVTCVVPSIT